LDEPHTFYPIGLTLKKKNRAKIEKDGRKKA